MGHNNNSVVKISLHQYNDIYAIRILPVTVFLGCLMLLGTIGNSLVCYIYTTKFKSTTTRSFILSLALLDLLSCLINIPLEITDMTHNYTYGTYAVCKLMPVLVTFSSLSSGAVLVIVAWERYMKICRPFTKQLTVSRAKVWITCACVLALVLSTPAGVLYGPRTIRIDSYMNGSECTIADEYVQTLYPLFYLGFQFIMFIAVTLTLTVLYSFVWRRVLHQHRFRTTMSTKRGRNKNDLSAKHDRPERCHGKIQPSTICPTMTTTPSIDSPDTTKISVEDSSDTSKVTFKDSLPEDATKIPVEKLPEKKVFSDTIYTIDTSDSQTTVSYADSCKQKLADAGLSRHTKSTGSCRKPIKEIKKVTIMLFLITLTFIVSFLPYLGLMVVMAVSNTEIGDMSSSEFVVFHFFLRSYFTQSAANPFIYSLCNAKFRMELKLLLRKSA